MAAAVLKLEEESRKGTCSTSRSSVWLSYAETDRTVSWQASNKCYLSLHLLPTIKAFQHPRHVISGGHNVHYNNLFLHNLFFSMGINKALNYVLTTTMPLPMQQEQSTGHDHNISNMQDWQHTGCLKSADHAVIKAIVQHRVLGSVLVALTATPQTVLCQNKERGQMRNLCFVQFVQPCNTVLANTLGTTGHSGCSVDHFIHSGLLVS